MDENSLKNTLFLYPFLRRPFRPIADHLYYSRLGLNLILKVTLLIILIGVLVPFSPKMPTSSLDASWALALNQAVALGLSFGHDLIFTLGPYSSIYTKAYHPFTDFMMVGGSLYLSYCYWLSFIILMRGIPWYWTVFWGLSLLTLIYARDSLFFTYPLLVGLVSYKIIAASKLSNKKDLNESPLSLIVLFAALGLLPLIKGTLLIECSLILLFCIVFFLWHKRISLVGVCLISPLISMILFWIGAGQSVANLPQYLITTITLAANFTEAMAFSGNSSEIFVYLLASSLLLLTIAGQKQLVCSDKLFLLSLFFTFLFLSFKTAFTRHYGHAFISSTSLVLAPLLLPYLFRSKRMVPLIFFCLYASYNIEARYTRVSLTHNFISTYTAAWHGLKNRIRDKNWLNQNFSLSMQFMKEQASFPVLQGKTDIYSYDQAYLIASGMAWDPRPIFQSYSVFNPQLAKKNKQHLLSDQRPDNIIFKIQPIDGRLPALEDGVSWPILLRNYQPVQLYHDFLFLKWSNTPAAPSSSQKLFIKEQHNIGEIVEVPEINSPLLAQIHLKPTGYGLLALSLLKAHSLFIKVALKNGVKKQFRLPTNMAQSEFLLSPLIEDTKEFALLYENPSRLDNQKIQSFTIISEPSYFPHWQKEYTIVYRKMRP